MIREGEFVSFNERVECRAGRFAVQYCLPSFRLSLERLGKSPSHLRVMAENDRKKQRLRCFRLPGIELDDSSDVTALLALQGPGAQMALQPLAETPLSEALMVVVPVASEVATPELLMVATAVLLEVQVTPANVKVLPSE